MIGNENFGFKLIYGEHHPVAMTEDEVRERTRQIMDALSRGIAITTSGATRIFINGKPVAPNPQP